MKMISFIYLSVFCLAYAAAVEQVQENGSTPAPEEAPRRELTDAGYVIRHGDEIYRYPLVIQPLVRRPRPPQKNHLDANPILTNEIQQEEDQRPLFYFTAHDDPRGLPTDRPFVQVRRKRAADAAEAPGTSQVGKLRRKRTYCRKCGGGGGYYAVPVSYAVYPVYYGGGGGGGRGCNTCGGGYGGRPGGYGGHGGYGGGGGSYSYSSSSAQSSSGSFGWGK